MFFEDSIGEEEIALGVVEVKREESVIGGAGIIIKIEVFLLIVFADGSSTETEGKFLG